MVAWTNLKSNIAICMKSIPIKGDEHFLLGEASIECSQGKYLGVANSPLHLSSMPCRPAGNPGRNVMSEDVRVAAAANAGSRHTGPLTSIYMEMDRIQMRADFATSQWDETLLKSKDAEQEVRHTYLGGLICFEAHEAWLDPHISHSSTVLLCVAR